MKKTIIEASKGISLDLKEVFEYRELLWTLTYRDIRIKYAQTVIGFIWAIANPLFTLIILSFVFGTVANIQVIGENGVPVPIDTETGEPSPGIPEIGPELPPIDIDPPPEPPIDPQERIDEDRVPLA